MNRQRMTKDVDLTECMRKVEELVGCTFDLNYSSKYKQGNPGEFKIQKFNPYKIPKFHYANETSKMQDIPISVECGTVTIQILKTKYYKNHIVDVKVYVNLRKDVVYISTVNKQGKWIRCYTFGEIE